MKKLRPLIILLMAGVMPAPLAGQDTMPPPPPLPTLPTMPVDGYWLDTAPLNEVFQYLAREARLQYFYNNAITTPEYNLTGQLRVGDPLQQMQDVAMLFGLNVHQQGSTVYVMNEQQLAQLPVQVMSYRLQYLRGSRPTRQSLDGGEGTVIGLADFEKLKAIIKPMLTPDVGAIEFEEKTNTLLVTDNSLRLERLSKLLKEIDKPSPQIAINVRVLRVSNVHGKRYGVDWRDTLGDGISISAQQSLNAIFDLPETDVLTRLSNTATEDFSSGSRQSIDGTTSTETNDFSSTFSGTDNTRRRINNSGPGLLFDAIEAEIIVRALEEDEIVNQEAAPTIITEDNEQGLITIVDRFPIITSTLSETTAGQNISEEVRYQIDERDPDPIEDPEKSREIGVTLSVTPTLLPDGTVRLKLRPRVAKIIDFIPGQTGNLYPRVAESTAESITRIPPGQSLILGGFYDYNDSDGDTKVPILGDIPVLGRLFKETQKKMEKVSLVFVITPNVFDAADPGQLHLTNEGTRILSGMKTSQINQLSSRLFPQEPEPMEPSDRAPVSGEPQRLDGGKATDPQQSEEKKSKQPWWNKKRKAEDPRQFNEASNDPGAGLEEVSSKKQPWLGRRISDIFGHKPVPSASLVELN